MNREKTIGIFKSALAVCAALACAFSVCSCGRQSDFVLNDICENVSVHTDLQSAYLAQDYNSVKDYATGKTELSHPRAVEFSWDDLSAQSYSVELSENNRFTSSLVYNTQLPQIEIYNLKIGTKYYWRVAAQMSDGSLRTSAVSAFTTESAAPRNLYVDGITNVRDLGGWKTINGKTVRQGMIFRCGRLNKSQTTDVKIEITEQGIRTMRDVLGVRTEIDLRMPDAYGVETGGITQSPLGSDINYVNIPMGWAKDASNFNYLSEEEYFPAIRRFFEIAADINNYPIIFHCNIGTDRTGLFAFLINGLLGVGEEDLYRDYLFSNFGKIGDSRSVSNIRSYVAKVKKFYGASLSEKIENCLVEEIGVPVEDIDAVIYNMLRN